MPLEWELVPYSEKKNHHIAFFSRKLTAHMQKQSTYVHELFVVTSAVSKF